MPLSFLPLFLCWGVFVDVSDASSDWCYTGCAHTPSHWSSISGSSCGGDRQSPIDIVTSRAVTDSSLHNFTLVNFSSSHVFKSLTNTGHTVKCILEENEVEVTGGGLNATYSTIQFHFHWGDADHHPGSEHTVDGHRYPMEMHIVSLKKGLSVEQATVDPEGIAVLGFFINATDDGETSQTWDDFTSYLMNITTKGSVVDVSHNISIADLIGDVDLTKFYRYMGSLTTPNCNEAVVWTVFQEPIKVPKNLMERFPEQTELFHVYRPTQHLNGRHVFASPAIPPAPSHAWCYDDHCDYSPEHWHLLPESHCDGERQSPINIKKDDAMEDKLLDDFTYTKFDDKHTMKYIINTGHTVKCVLKDGMVEVSGGGLGYVYSTLQFHFHWGSGSDDSVGSEHTVDSKRYPMEMHIVNMRKDLTLEQAKEAPNGLAVLGFFIEPADGHKSGGGGSEHHEESSTSHTDPWKTFTSYLSAIKNISSQVEVTEDISIDDLIGDVDRSMYYRYNGSLTTPSCNEAVVWTVFKEPIKVDKDLMKMFPHRAGYHNVYRPTQSLHSRKVYTTAASSAPGPMMLILLLACFCVFAI
ncbi:carbonic anhydrase 4-like [Myripristis murdjan]|uniref:Carbonic anhydrase n=1 Tax=Myripristis murdjan TaxID=586833 RepID=A0A667WXB2_9TELE|nr:carbonic anhydrase 4-like [Myripristis murdjan]XP_029933708.1 carbonic anhydrase 4-like [Myripristis murdjan]XP_029933709.1 carbonic anhydrase 4-like [Myripristis murdjan]